MQITTRVPEIFRIFKHTRTRILCTVIIKYTLNLYIKYTLKRRTFGIYMSQRKENPSKQEQISRETLKTRKIYNSAFQNLKDKNRKDTSL